MNQKKKGGNDESEEEKSAAVLSEKQGELSALLRSSYKSNSWKLRRIEQTENLASI